MSKKAFLITVFIISLLLIGLMMLIADARIVSFSSDYSAKEQKLQEVDESAHGKEDSLQKQSEATKGNYPKVLTQFNTKTDELLQFIQSLKENFIPNGDLSKLSFEEMEAQKNEILFVGNTNKYTEKGKQFLAKIEAYEQAIASIHIEFPKTNTQTFKLRDIREDKDWLIYNYKDFPVITSYTKLRNLAEAVKTKRKDIFTTVLRD